MINSRVGKQASRLDIDKTGIDKKWVELYG